MSATAAPPERIRVWAARGGWRCCRVVRRARDGKRIAVRFALGGGRWTGPRWVAIANTQPIDR